jgi:hypothetical protein
MYESPYKSISMRRRKPHSQKHVFGRREKELEFQKTVNVAKGENYTPKIYVFSN